MYIAQRLFCVFGFQRRFKGITSFLQLLLTDVNDVLYQKVPLQTVDTMAVQYHLKSAGRASEDASRIVVWVFGVVEVTGAAAAQIVLAW